MQVAINAMHRISLFEPRILSGILRHLPDVGTLRHAYSRPWFVNGKKAIRKPPVTVHKFPEGGDAAPALPVSGNELVSVLRNSKLLENVPDRVRRLYSLEFATGKDRLEFRRREMYRQCGLDELDQQSLAARIVDITLEIRTGYDHVKRNHKDRRGVRRIRRKIGERTALIHELLETDSAQVRRICESLGIEYSLPSWPVPSEWMPTETQQRKTAVVLEAMRTRNDKLCAYREALEAELRRFETRRAAQVAAIDAELRALPPSDAAAGIMGARELLAEIVAERRERAMQPVYEDRYARLLSLYDRGVLAKEEATRTYAAQREAKITERLAKMRQTMAQSAAASAKK